MLSSDRRLFLRRLTGALLAGSVLTACGFTPAYAPTGAANRLQNSVLVDPPKNRAGFLLVREIEERLGRAGTERYGLSHSISLEEDDVAITEEDVTTRFNILGEIEYALRDLDSGAVLQSGTVESFTSYSASGSTVATQSAQRDAEERLIVILSDQILIRLAAGAGSLPE